MDVINKRTTDPNDQKNIRVRNLFVMKEKYLGKDQGFMYILVFSDTNPDLIDVTASISQSLTKFRTEMTNIKDADFECIGYVRKSPPRTNEKPENRVRLLQQMINRLQERSMVQKVFVSPNCSSGQALNDRDVPQPKDVLQKLKGAQVILNVRCLVEC